MIVDPKQMHKHDPNVYYNAATQEGEMGGAMTDGTTIIACKYNGGILLAADGRSSNVSKIYQNLSLIISILFVFRVCMLEINAQISLSQSIREFIARDLEPHLILVILLESLDIMLMFKQLN